MIAVSRLKRDLARDQSRDQIASARDHPIRFVGFSASCDLPTNMLQRRRDERDHLDNDVSLQNCVSVFFFLFFFTFSLETISSDSHAFLFSRSLLFINAF